jgi:hypothetical protein
MSGEFICMSIDMFAMSCETYIVSLPNTGRLPCPGEFYLAI